MLPLICFLAGFKGTKDHGPTGVLDCGVCVGIAFVVAFWPGDAYDGLFTWRLVGIIFHIRATAMRVQHGGGGCGVSVYLEVQTHGGDRSCNGIMCRMRTFVRGRLEGLESCEQERCVIEEFRSIVRLAVRLCACKFAVCWHALLYLHVRTRTSIYIVLGMSVNCGAVVRL